MADDTTNKPFIQPKLYVEYIGLLNKFPMYNKNPLMVPNLYSAYTRYESYPHHNSFSICVNLSNPKLILVANFTS